mgnify:FL=1
MWTQIAQAAIGRFRPPGVNDGRRMFIASVYLSAES